jgi:hypothetical protein
LGECTKIHEYALRADYERAASTRDLYYEMDVSMIIKKKLWVFFVLIKGVRYVK